jgi:hypothetical protein
MAASQISRSSHVCSIVESRIGGDFRVDLVRPHVQVAVVIEAIAALGGFFSR